MPRTLTFCCSVKKGIGKHSDLRIPGTNELPDAPSDWPTTLQPGSLNALIDDNGYPDGFESLGSGPGMKKLDDGCFEPEFVIPKDKIKNNSKGDAQVWRACIVVNATGEEIACWALRRIGSGIKKQIELVSAVHLRNTFRLGEDAKVTVRLFERQE
ncbi:MAG: hypothetical protein WED34_21220 [Planctomycetales bacterium]